MEKSEKKSKNYYTIDILHIAKFLWKKVWIIILAGVLAGSAGFALARFVIQPTYSSEVMLYVNNKMGISGMEFNISSSDLTASQNLVKTYGVILDNRTTLERIIEKADVDYTYEELSSMISYGSKKDTEVMYITVTSTDPNEAAHIANCIRDELPAIIEDIIEGAKMKTVSSAVPNNNKVAPSITKYTAVGLFLGALVSILAITIIAIADDRIHDEDYIIENYDYPILAKIPNLVENNSKKYGYYYQSKSKSDVDNVTQK